jgi:integrase
MKRTGREPLTVARAAQQWWESFGRHTAEVDLGPVSSEPEFSTRPLNWLVARLGPERFLHDIRGGDVQRLIDERRQALVGEAGGARRRVSARTVNRTVTKLLRRIFRKARKVFNAEIPNEPDWGALLLKERKASPRVIRFDEEVRMAEAERPELTVVREFAVLSGLRLANVAALTWFNVDFENRRITIRQKGDDPHVVPITASMEALLRSLRGHHESAVFTFVAKRTRRDPHSGKQFIRGTRYPLTYWGICAARRRDWDKAGVDVKFHDLRRMAAQTLRSANAGDASVAQRLLGHKDLQTTQLYLGLTDEERMRDAMERRDAYLAEQRARVAAPLEKRERGK